MDTLLKKLNFKEGMRIFVIAPPEEFTPTLATWTEHLAPSPNQANFFLIFVKTEEEIRADLEQVKAFIQSDEVFWIAYPKGSSKKYKVNINRDTGWEILGKNEFEGVRQVAIDSDWSALRFRKLEFIKVLTRKNRLT